MLALYGLTGNFNQGCLDALAGSTKMLERIEFLNKDIKDELDEPLRIGIDKHSGEAIADTMGPPKAPSLSAIADIIKMAARLGTKTKVLNCNIIVSSDTVRHAGLIPDLALEHQVDELERDGKISVLTLDSVYEIPEYH